MVYTSTVSSRFKKDLNLQIHLHKAFFSDNRFLDSYHKSFLNQTTLDLRKEKWSFLNREFTVVPTILHRSLTQTLHLATTKAITPCNFGGKVRTT